MKIYVPEPTSNTTFPSSISKNSTPSDLKAGMPFSFTPPSLFAGIYTVAVVLAGIVTAQSNVSSFLCHSL